MRKETNPESLKHCCNSSQRNNVIVFALELAELSAHVCTFLCENIIKYMLLLRKINV